MDRLNNYLRLPLTIGYFIGPNKVSCPHKISISKWSVGPVQCHVGRAFINHPPTTGTNSGVGKFSESRLIPSDLPFIFPSWGRPDRRRWKRWRRDARGTRRPTTTRPTRVAGGEWRRWYRTTQSTTFRLHLKRAEMRTAEVDERMKMVGEQEREIGRASPFQRRRRWWFTCIIMNPLSKLRSKSSSVSVKWSISIGKGFIKGYTILFGSSVQV